MDELVFEDVFLVDEDFVLLADLSQLLFGLGGEFDVVLAVELGVVFDELFLGGLFLELDG